MNARLLSFFFAVVIAISSQSITGTAAQQSAPNSQQKTVDIATQLKQEEEAIKSLEDRPQVTPEQALYLRKIYDSRNDFKTVIDAEDGKFTAKIDANDAKLEAKIDQLDSYNRAQIREAH
jgi:hypothetical protein